MHSRTLVADKKFASEVFAYWTITETVGPQNRLRSRLEDQHVARSTLRFRAVVGRNVEEISDVGVQRKEQSTGIPKHIHAIGRARRDVAPIKRVASRAGADGPVELNRALGRGGRHVKGGIVKRSSRERDRDVRQDSGVLEGRAGGHVDRPRGRETCQDTGSQNERCSELLHALNTGGAACCFRSLARQATGQAAPHSKWCQQMGLHHRRLPLQGSALLLSYAGKMVPVAGISPAASAFGELRSIT